MKTLYPPPRNIQQFSLEVDGHRLHIQVSGNPAGIPVLFLHGGPGSGCRPQAHQFFDPLHYRVVLMDQRGCGRSEPQGSLHNNTSWHLLNDIEALRLSLNVDRWLLFGGSWGACLALYYAQHYPSAVAAMILRGIFLGRVSDRDGLFSRAAQAHFHQAWRAFSMAVNQSEGEPLVSAYYRCLRRGDLASRYRYAKLWEDWSATVTLGRPPTPGGAASLSQQQGVVARASVALHYAHHGYFLSDRPLLANIDNTPRVPIKIIHGQNDLLCPIYAAQTLAQALPWASFSAVADAGHIAEDPQISQTLVAATDEYAHCGAFR